MDRAPRSTRAELLNRISETQDMLASGKPISDIVRFMSETHGISSRMTQRYITAVYRRWIKQREKNIDERYARHISMRYKLMNEEGVDKRTKLEIMRDIAKLEQMYVENVKVQSVNIDALKAEAEAIFNAPDDTRSDKTKPA
jgi:hypothetical protein